LLRRYADVVTLFESDMTPYWLALLEWTYSVIAYRQVSPRQKRYAACSAALICRALEHSRAEELADLSEHPSVRAPRRPGRKSHAFPVGRSRCGVSLDRAWTKIGDPG